MSTLLWFRRDLRLSDNAAIGAALEELKSSLSSPQVDLCGGLIPVYTLDEGLGAVSHAWRSEALKNLNSALQDTLRVFSSKIIDVVKELSQKITIEAVYFNRCYEPSAIKEELELIEFLREKNIRFKAFKGYLLCDDFQIKNKTESFYKVFTAYYKRVIATLEKDSLHRYEDISLDELRARLVSRSQLGHLPHEVLLEEIASRDSVKTKKIVSQWRVGEEGAYKFLNSLDEKIPNYKIDRDFLSLDGTSKLAPYLHFGHITPGRILAHINDIRSKETFIRQLVWRDFAYYTLYHSPQMRTECIQEEYRDFPWERDEKNFSAWQNGETGFPIIDAAMSELRSTGYMHNRARMITASFLTKNLNIDWRLGQEHFWNYLCDANLANNSFGWQWVAGCGRDASPYFRIFNPALQGKKFDTNAVYIKKFMPQLSHISSHDIHSLHSEDSSKLLSTTKIGQNYCRAIVDLDASRKKALSRFKKWKER